MEDAFEEKFQSAWDFFNNSWPQLDPSITMTVAIALVVMLLVFIVSWLDHRHQQSKARNAS